MNPTKTRRVIDEVVKDPQKTKRYVKSKTFVNEIVKDPHKPSKSPILMGALAAAGIVVTLLILTK